MYIHTHASFNKETKLLTIRLSSRENHDAGQPGRVRVQAIQGLWQLKEETPQKTRILYQIYTNPQLPASALLDAYMVESVFHTLKGLRNLSVAN